MVKSTDQLSERINAREKAAIKKAYQLYFKPCKAIIIIKSYSYQ